MPEYKIPELVSVIKNKEIDIHVQLAKLAKKAHLFASQNNKIELIKVEEEIDKLVAHLYNITDEEYKEIKSSLAILEDKEVEEGDEEVVEHDPYSNVTNSPNLFLAPQTSIASLSQATPSL